MNNEDNNILYVYEGDYGLASLDIECIQSILHLKIAKVPVQIELLGNITNCLKYNAPTLVNNNKKYYNYSGIVEYTQTNNHEINRNLSSKQCSELLALVSFVNSKLKPVLDYVFWMDLRNCEDFIKPWYMKALPLPFNYIRARNEQNKSENLIESLYPNDTNINLVKSYMVTSANECLSALSGRLGKSDYFFDSSPTTLDIIVYSYLAPLVKLPFPSNEFGNLLNSWPNLCIFVKRIDAKYLADVPIGVKYLKKENVVRATNDDEVSYTAVAIIVLSTLTLMFGFAVNKGLIKSNLP